MYPGNAMRKSENYYVNIYCMCQTDYCYYLECTDHAYYTTVMSVSEWDEVMPFFCDILEVQRHTPLKTALGILQGTYTHECVRVFDLSCEHRPNYYVTYSVCMKQKFIIQCMCRITVIFEILDLYMSYKSGLFHEIKSAKFFGRAFQQRPTPIEIYPLYSTVEPSLKET